MLKDESNKKIINADVIFIIDLRDTNTRMEITSLLFLKSALFH